MSSIMNDGAFLDIMHSRWMDYKEGRESDPVLHSCVITHIHEEAERSWNHAMRLRAQLIKDAKKSTPDFSLEEYGQWIADTMR